jgi:hypothetical protein
MSIVRCPRCRDEVTIPAKAPLTALVRCPLCHEKYLLSEAASQLPPALILVVSELEPKAADQQPTNDAPAADEYRLGEIQGGLIETQAGLRPPVRLAPRLPRKEKNALAEAAKIIGGGVAGLAMGLVVLWWGLRQDPLELGPLVSSYVPWLVPQQFHPKPSTAPSAATSAPRSQIVITSDRKKADEKHNARPKNASPIDATEDDQSLRQVPPATEPAAEARQVSLTEPVPAPIPAPMPDLRDLLPDDPPAPTRPSPRD